MNTQKLKEDLIKLIDSYEVDHELEAVKEKFKSGYFRYEDINYVLKIKDIYRSEDNIIVSAFGHCGLLYTNFESCFTPCAPEPTWPDFIKDGTWLYYSDAIRDWQLTNEKPEWINNIHGRSLCSCLNSYSTTLNFLSNLFNISIKDFNIPDVPPEDRCWCKGGAHG